MGSRVYWLNPTIRGGSQRQRVGEVLPVLYRCVFIH